MKFIDCLLISLKFGCASPNSVQPLLNLIITLLLKKLITLEYLYPRQLKKPIMSRFDSTGKF